MGIPTAIWTLESVLLAADSLVPSLTSSPYPQSFPKHLVTDIYSEMERKSIYPFHQLFLIFIYLFGYTRSSLQHAGSLVVACGI